MPYTILATSTQGVLTPLSMQSPYLKISYSSDQADLVTIQEPYSTTGHAVLIKASGLGRSEITVQAEFNHPKLASYRHTFSFIVQVEEKLKMIDYPEREIILAPRATYRLRTNKDSTSTIKYTLLKSNKYEPVIHVDKDGKITSKNSHGLTVVVAEDAQAQTTTQAVKVQQPWFMKLVDSSVAGKHVEEFKLPLGAEVSISLIPQTEKGESFASIDAMDVKLRVCYVNSYLFIH